MKVLYEAVKHHIHNRYYNTGNVMLKANRKMAFGGKCGQ